MLLFEILGDEDHPIYKKMETENGHRHYQFLNSTVNCALEVNKLFLSQSLIKAFNYHAITSLHINAGEYRVCPVYVGSFKPVEHYRVAPLMDDLVNTVNRYWDSTSAIALASYVLWRINHIHPFVNGNGRASRAACYFVLCVKLGVWLPGSVILPELIRQNREEHIKLLQELDEPEFERDFSNLNEFITRLLRKQLEGAVPTPN